MYQKDSRLTFVALVVLTTMAGATISWAADQASPTSLVEALTKHETALAKCFSPELDVHTLKTGAIDVVGTLRAQNSCAIASQESLQHWLSSYSETALQATCPSSFETSAQPTQAPNKPSESEATPTTISASHDPSIEPPPTPSPEGLATDVASKSNWVDVTYTDDMAGSTIFVLVARGQTTDYYSLPEFYIRCQDNKTEVFLSWGRPVASLLARPSTWAVRLDEGPIQELEVLLSSDWQASFVPSGWAFAKRMLTASRLRARITPPGSPSITVDFDISGLSESIGPLRTACGW